MKTRLKTNPVLGSLVEGGPEILVYVETQTKLYAESLITGYDTYSHPAEPTTFRRGISVFYKKTLRQVFTKEHTSEKFDIIWLRLQPASKEIVLCFFYAPHDKHTEATRREFYEELATGYTSYPAGTKIFMMGDSNARLGTFSGDRSIHGAFISNNNKDIFLGFLQYTGMVYLNNTFQKGKPTFETHGVRQSIIDVALTNCHHLVKDFRILPHIVGTSLQTSHRVLQLTIESPLHKVQPNTSNKIRKYRYCSYENLLRVRNSISSRIRYLQALNPSNPHTFSYSVLCKMYTNAKVRILGFAKNSKKREYISKRTREIQDQIELTHAQYLQRKTGKLHIRLHLLEKELTTSTNNDAHIHFNNWLSKLNKLDYSKATRSFFSELKQRSRDPEYFGPVKNSDGTLSTNLHECLQNWASFYSVLYRKKGPNIETIDIPINGTSTKKLSYLDCENLNKEFTRKDLILAINNLRDYTASGVDGILSRDLTVLLHVEEGDPDIKKNFIIIDYILKIIADFWDAEKVTPNFKRSTLRPFLKKAGEDATQPDNFRPIALLNVLMKVYEHMIKSRLVPLLEKKNFFSPAQAAYRTEKSTVDHIFVIQELFYHYRFVGGRWDKRKKLYLCFLDLRKAFDSVPRNLLFKKLESLGLEGKMLKVIQDLYTSNTASVRVGQYESDTFLINSGVMQGSTLGPILFAIFINDLLNQLHCSKLGACVGGVTVSSLGFADDIVLVADSESKMQELIDICETWSSRNGMCFNVTKCKVMVLNGANEQRIWKLFDQTLEVKKLYKYLGVTLSSTRLTSLYTNHFNKIIKKASKRLHCIRHFGFERDGLRPLTSIRMYMVLIRPILEYAAQTLSFRHYYFKTTKNENNNYDTPTDTESFVSKLEKLQNKLLKHIIPCPRSTPPALVRLFTGVEPMVARIETLKLRYFWKLSHCKNSLAAQIYRYKRDNFLETDKGFLHEVFTICCKLDCLDIWHGICAPKENPLIRIKKIVQRYYFKRDMAVARASQCLYVSLHINCRPTHQNHYIFEQYFTRPGIFTNATSRSIFLYSLFDTCSFEKQCSWCQSKTFDIVQHKITECKGLSRQRSKLRLTLVLYNVDPSFEFDNKEKMFNLAYRRRLYMKVLCEFLLETSYYHNTK